jgi:hypothetical protein
VIHAGREAPHSKTAFAVSTTAQDTEKEKKESDPDAKKKSTAKSGKSKKGSGKKLRQHRQ